MLVKHNKQIWWHNNIFKYLHAIYMNDMKSENNHCGTQWPIPKAIIILRTYLSKNIFKEMFNCNILLYIFKILTLILIF